MIATPAPPRQSATLPGVLAGTSHGYIYCRDGRTYRVYPSDRWLLVADIEARIGDVTRWRTYDITIEACRAEFASELAAATGADVRELRRDLHLMSLSVRLARIDASLSYVPADETEDRGIELLIRDLERDSARRVGRFAFAAGATVMEVIR